MTNEVKKLKGAGGVKGDKLVGAGILTAADMKGGNNTKVLILSSELEGILYKKLAE